MQRVYLSDNTLLLVFLLLSFLAQSLTVFSTAQQQQSSSTLDNNTSLLDDLGPAFTSNLPVHRKSLGARKNQATHQAHSSQSSGHHEHHQQQQQRGKKPNVGSPRKHDVAIPSTDCQAKRSEVLSRHIQTNSTASTRAATTSSPPLANFQKLRPKIDSGSSSLATPSWPGALNESPVANSSNAEHIPACKADGSYEPIQCHKFSGWCWCVNKYGQAIKNSASMFGKDPICEPAIYESESDDVLVVAGISNQRLKNFLKPTAIMTSDSTTPDGNINFEATESSVTTAEHTDSEGHQQVGTQGPLMPLLPNDCKTSQTTARDRAMSQVNDSIWVPECDTADKRYYAELQCHKLPRVCWCVDQSTGLPLRRSEHLSARSANCTEIKKILKLTSQVARPKPSASSLSSSSSSLSSSSSSLSQTTTATSPLEPAFYQGSSDFCDTDKRIEFVVALGNQFRQQISEYLRQNPPASLAPSNLTSTNPHEISDVQVSEWKFNIMDKDSDDKLDDREWSKFKNNFKLVDKPDELDNPYKQQKGPYFTLAPLLIVRSQRKCWRDFLEFCASGDLMINESISLSKWLSCTELPPKLPRTDQPNQSNRNGQTNISMENTYAHSREAAIVRSKKKNPFLGILKPD